MSIITVTTDWGSGDPDLASLKGMLLTNCGTQTQIVDINTNITPLHYQEAAYVLKNCYSDFPKNTIHLALVNLPGSVNTRLILAKKENAFFVLPDNGMLSLIFDTEPENVYELTARDAFRKPGYSNRKVIANICKELSANTNYTSTLKQVSEYKTLIKPLAVKKSNGLNGKVIYVDKYENLITDISRSLFEEVGKGRPFTLHFRKQDTIERLSEFYCDYQDGDRICFFDSKDHLKIALIKGKASSLFGLKVNDTILIDFK